MKPERNIYKLKTIATREIYEAKRTEANRICIEKNRIWINNKIRQIEEANNKNDVRTFFKEAQVFNKQKSLLTNIL